MIALAVEGIDLFKIAGRSISEWIPSLIMWNTLVLINYPTSDTPSQEE